MRQNHTRPMAPAIKNCSPIFSTYSLGLLKLGLLKNNILLSIFEHPEYPAGAKNTNTKEHDMNQYQSGKGIENPHTNGENNAPQGRKNYHDLEANCFR